MFEKISRSWSLVKASASVLQADKELMIFPVLSTAALVVTSVVFFAPAAFFAFAGTMSDFAQVTGYVVAFLFYFVSTFVMVFFNSALVGAALIRLDGGDPTVSDGLRIARERIGLIFQWSLLAASVGMILRAVRERSGWLGSLVSSIVGLAWNLATFLIVPVLVTHDLGPIDALKKSASLLKKTWGEQIAGNAGIGLVFGLVALVFSLIAVPVVVFSFGSGSIWVVVPVILAVVLGYALIALVSTTLSGIYSAALFRYATTGESGYMDQRLLASAFEQK